MIFLPLVIQAYSEKESGLAAEFPKVVSVYIYAMSPSLCEMCLQRILVVASSIWIEYLS